jgi:O-antigen/teichoic acid export membrane protein
MGEASNVLLFVLALLAPRWLGPTSFGYFTTGLAFVGVFRVLPDFGMAYASTLAISRDRSLAERLTGGILGFQAVLSVVTLALCLLAGRGLYDGVAWAAVAILSVDLIFKSLKGTFRWVLKALERFDAEAVSLLVERALLLGLGVAVLASGRGVVALCLVFAAVRLAEALALSGYIHWRVLPLRPRYEPALWWDLLRKGLPYAWAGAMITLVFDIDAVLLEAMRGAQEVGFYRAPVQVLAGLMLVPRVLGYAFIPAMAALHAKAPETVSEMYRRGSKYLLVAGLPIAAFAVLESPRFVHALFGAEYAPSGPACRVLLPAAVFMFLSNFGETTLACVNRWRTIVVVSTVTLALNVALNLVWVPRHGFLGSSWATLVTEATYFALGAAALRSYGLRASWAAIGWRPLLATVFFAVTLWLGRGLPLLAVSALASVVFVAATFAFGVWDEKEKGLVAGWLRRATA